MFVRQKSQISLVYKPISANVKHICRHSNDVKSDVTYAQVVAPRIGQNGDLF